MTVEHVVGDLFDAGYPAIGHGVNCQGAMGAGIAVQFRNRYPEMYEGYRRYCTEGLLLPGDVYSYDAPNEVVYNLATQNKTGRDARYGWVVDAVTLALEDCEARGIDRLALPRIGCGIGGLEWGMVSDLLGLTAKNSPVTIVAVTHPKDI